MLCGKSPELFLWIKIRNHIGRPQAIDNYRALSIPCMRLASEA